MAGTKRAESQERTRARLVATAREIFVRDGYAQTSLGRVATEAGFTKGAVYANFAGKHELGLAVLDAVRGEHALEVAELVAAGSGSPEDRLAALDAWARRVLGDRDWVALEVEFALAIRSDPVAAEALLRRNRAIRALLATTLGRLRDEFDLVFLAGSPEDAADVILGLGVGIGTLRAADPALPVDGFTTTVRAMLGLPVRTE